MAEHADKMQNRLKSIGARIREARTARDMTLDALARSVGLSVTFLSRLERGHVACSIGNLLEIAGFLGLAPAELFDDAQGEPPAAFRVVRAGDERRTGSAPGHSWAQLASGRAEQRLEAFHLVLSDVATAPPLVTHPGEEFCYVIEGEVEFRVGDDVIRLAQGDSIHLRSDIPHMAWRAGTDPARLLMVTAIENVSATAVEWWSQARAGANARPAAASASEPRRRRITAREE